VTEPADASQTPVPERTDVVVSPAVRAELLDPAVWRDALVGYARATKLAVLMIDANGTPIGSCINPHRLWDVIIAAKASTTACPFCVHPGSTCQALSDARRSGAIVLPHENWTAR
jgi:hypothetical protein